MHHSYITLYLICSISFGIFFHLYSFFLSFLVWPYWVFTVAQGLLQFWCLGYRVHAGSYDSVVAAHWLTCLKIDGILFPLCVCQVTSVMSDSVRRYELYSPPGSSVHGILQARTLEWVASAFLQGIFLTEGSNPRL